MLLEHAEMDEDVALGLVADDEAEAARRVEPFDGAGELDERFAIRVRSAVGCGRAAGSLPAIEACPPSTRAC